MPRSAVVRILIGFLIVSLPFAVAGTTDGGSSRELLFAEISLGALFAIVRLRAQTRQRASEARRLSDRSAP